VMAKAPADPTEGGLRCLACGAVNVVGALVCARCDEPIERPLEITAQDLGIELHDGKMAVILPKNTAFPTPEDQPIGREFATAVTDQRRLEIVIHQGSDEWALRNELCGYLTLALPPGLPRNSPINVAFGLDGSRMITVSVRVRALGEEPRRVQIQHSSRLDPEDIRRLEEHRRGVTTFVDRWTSELFPAESVVCYQMIGELEEMIGGSGVSRDAVNEMAARADRLVETVADARGQAAYVSAVQASIGRYVAESDRAELEGFASAIEGARERADWGAALVVGRQAEEFVGGFGPAMRTLVFCRTFAVQGKLSPALSHRVMGTVRAFDGAFDRGDQVAMDQALAELVDIHGDVSVEMNNRDDDVVAITKPGLGGV
jgi:molecular chaperone DnaK